MPRRDIIDVKTVDLTRDLEVDPEGVDRLNLAIGIAAILVLSALGAIVGHVAVLMLRGLIA